MKTLKTEKKVEITVVGSAYDNVSTILRITTYTDGIVTDELDVKVKDGEKITIPYNVVMSLEVN